MQHHFARQQGTGKAADQVMESSGKGQWLKVMKDNSSGESEQQLRKRKALAQGAKGNRCSGKQVDRARAIMRQATTMQGTTTAQGWKGKGAWHEGQQPKRPKGDSQMN